MEFTKISDTYNVILRNNDIKLSAKFQKQSLRKKINPYEFKFNTSCKILVYTARGQMLD